MKFNDGAYGISNVLEQFSIKYGIYTNTGSSKKDESSIRWSSTESSKARKKNVNNYLASNKVSLTKIMNKNKLLIFLVDFKVIYAIYIIFVTLYMFIFDFFLYFIEILFLVNFRHSKLNIFSSKPFHLKFSESVYKLL